MKLIDLVGAFAAGVLVVALASCVSAGRHDYPNDWSPMSAGDGACPHLTGSYANSGRGTPSVLLAKWILPKTTARLERIERLKMAGPTDGRITVRLMEGPSTEVAVREWKEGTDYRCENGWLVLSLESILIPPFGYFESAKLTRAVDGQLIVDSTQTAFGLSPYAPLVPVAQQSGQWHLYPLLPE